MARKRKAKGPSRGAHAHSLPSSAEMIGHLVALLQLPDDPAGVAATLRNRTALRFLAGEVMPASVGAKVVRALATALTEHGYLDTDEWPTMMGFPSAAMLAARALDDLRVRWDKALVVLRRGMGVQANPGPVHITLARLVLIDLAVRAGAWLTLRGFEPGPTPTIPDRLGVADVMASVVKSSGRSAEKLAEELSVERTTVDAWRKGARPKDAALLDLATVLASKDRDAARRLHARLRGMVALAALVERLARLPWIEQNIDELWDTFWQMFYRIAQLLAGFFEDERRAAGEAPVLTALVMWGSQHPLAVPLLGELRLSCPQSWQADLESGPRWSDRLGFAMGVAQALPKIVVPADAPPALRELMSKPELVEAVAGHILAGPIAELMPPGKFEGWHMLRIKNPPPIAAANRMMQGGLARSRGQLEDAIVHFRRAVELTPDDAEAHLSLGSTLAMTRAYDEGLAECHIAVALRPDWELARVEIGIVLIWAERYEAARAHLEQVAADVPAPSSHLKFNLGTARWRCGDHAGGLALFEEVLKDEANQSYPYVLDQAAHCAFVLGDEVRGRRYAKEANDLGVATTYDRWRRGECGR